MNISLNTTKKGFTLIELLIVIAILAILAAAVVIVLNPGELLAQARDAQRISDMSSLLNALTLYIAQAPNANLGTACSVTTTDGCCTVSGCVSGFTGDGGAGTVQVGTGTAIDGNGWIPVNLTTVAGGSPIPFLPIDPTNTTTYFYAFANSGNSFELNARLESQKHRGKMTTDGGEDIICSTWTEATCLYEVGTDPGLNL